jgi:hypothetical protein
MIKFNCETQEHASLIDLIPFQGNLKKRTDKDVEDLAASIVTDGLMTPLIVWHKDDKMLLIDGHARREALLRLVLKGDNEILSQQLPILVFNAETEEDARKAVLQISSSYGKVTKQGAIEFTKSIVDYNAPVLKHVTASVKAPKVQESNRTIIRLSVDNSILDKLTKLLKETDGVRVLK